jgi:general nucleoside transport system ATP-binding protein
MPPGAATGESVVLSLANISKRFGAQLAVDDVSLHVRTGTVHALLGENGAGKTTLMRIAFGLVGPDAGEVRSGAGRRITSAADAIANGLGMVHQHFTNVAAMTVAENVALGGRGPYRRSTAERRVAEIGARTGLALEAGARAGDLTVGAQQRLEIMKALARDARVLILDEPTAVLAPQEIDELLRWLRGFADAGNAVVLITHKLREALAIADEATVLRRGRVAWRSPATTMTIESLSRALLGEEPTAHDVPAASTAGETVAVAVAEHLSLVDARSVTVIRDASFTVRSGEIVGIAAVEGAGQRELLRALAGRHPIAFGSLRRPENVGFVPEDRHGDALVLDFTSAENLALRGSGARRGRIRLTEDRSRARTAIADYDIRGAGDATAVRALSGGNQQKLVLARELAGAPQLVVAENPTRGLDIRATRAVHDRLRAAATNGTAVVAYSSDLDEVLALATRVLVVHAGRVIASPRDRDAVGRAMLGAS